MLSCNGGVYNTLYMQSQVAAVSLELLVVGNPSLVAGRYLILSRLVTVRGPPGAVLRVLLDQVRPVSDSLSHEGPCGRITHAQWWHHAHKMEVSSTQEGGMKHVQRWRPIGPMVLQV